MVWATPNAKTRSLNPTLAVPHGLFYTLRTTGSTFRRQKPEGDGVLEVGSLADYVGANIYLKAGGSVELNIGGTVKCSNKPRR